MTDKLKKQNDIVVISKFKEQAGVDIKTTIEQAFKIFYEMRVNKR